MAGGDPGGSNPRRALPKPTWNPPAWVFGPVWTVLYISMAVAAWLVWRQAGFTEARMALGLFAIQLTLNAGWSKAGICIRRRSVG